jgi:hypothetical protein
MQLVKKLEVVQSIAMMVDLEVSLVFTLPKMARKGPEDRIPLDRAAAAMFDDALMKHADAIRTKIATANPFVAAKAEELKRARAAREEADGPRAVGAQTACLMEADLAELQAELKLAECDLQQSRDGPMAAFRILLDELDERQNNNSTVELLGDDSMNMDTGSSNDEVSAKFNGRCCELQQRSEF